MAQLTPTQAQQLEFGTLLRIKFASITARGELRGDALEEEYPAFFAELPAGWTADRLGTIETRTEATRLAWHLCGPDIDVVAVEHETGVEILLFGILTDVASAAILGLATWGWKRWKKLRESASIKEDPSIVIEVPRGSAIDGGPAPTVKIVIPPPVSADELERYLRVASSFIVDASSATQA